MRSRTVWSVGAAPAKVAVPIVVDVPSSGMLLGLPSGRENAKPSVPVAANHGAPFAPTACAVTLVGWVLPG
jgi:hypothetical protein